MDNNSTTETDIFNIFILIRKYLKLKQSYNFEIPKIK